jgi:hypothetical protein
MTGRYFGSPYKSRLLAPMDQNKRTQKNDRKARRSGGKF